MTQSPEHAAADSPRFIVLLCATTFAASAGLSAAPVVLAPSATFAAAPFGFIELSVACWLAAWPAAVLIALRARRHMPPRRLAIVGLTFGIGGVALSYAASTYLAERAESLGAAIYDRAWLWSLARFAITSVAQTLLAIGLAAALSRRQSAGGNLATVRGAADNVALALALFAAWALPWAYAAHLETQQGEHATTLLMRGRLLSARRIVSSLAAMGSRQPLWNDRPPRECLTQMNQQISATEKYFAAYPKPRNSEERFRRATALASLERWSLAVGEIEPLAREDADAALLTAAILQNARRFERSSRWYREALRLLGPGDDKTLPKCVRAVEGLAFNAREEGRPREAERHYLEAIARWPATEARLSLRLGQHYAAGGRPFEARQALRRAMERDPTLRPEIESEMSRLTSATPACVLTPSVWQPKELLPAY